jgi:uncharacterized membrane protein YgdD (TMEM256/DUF423 family)
MHRTSLVYAAIFGGLAVALGAFGAHSLERLTTDAKVLHGFHTGVEYQMYHALALLATGILAANYRSNWIKWASRCFITGIILFSGSLYIITFLKIQGSTGVRFAGPITPLGGMFFIFGWLCLLVAVLRKA